MPDIIWHFRHVLKNEKQSQNSFVLCTFDSCCVLADVLLLSWLSNTYVEQSSMAHNCVGGSIVFCIAKHIIHILSQTKYVHVQIDVAVSCFRSVNS